MWQENSAASANHDQHACAHACKMISQSNHSQSRKHTQHCSQFYNYTANYGRPLILLKTHVVLVRVACGSNIRSNALAHLIPFDTTPSHAHNQRLKPWSPLNHLLTHVILVRVACGSYIRSKPCKYCSK